MFDPIEFLLNPEERQFRLYMLYVRFSYASTESAQRKRIDTISEIHPMYLKDFAQFIAKKSWPNNKSKLGQLRLCLEALEEKGELAWKLDDIELAYKRNLTASPEHPIGLLLAEKRSQLNAEYAARKEEDAAYKAALDVAIDQRAPGIISALRNLEEETSGKFSFRVWSKEGDNDYYLETTLLAPDRKTSRRDDIKITLTVTDSDIICTPSWLVMPAFDFIKSKIDEIKILFEATGDNRVKAVEEYLNAQAFEQGFFAPDGTALMIAKPNSARPSAG